MWSRDLETFIFIFTRPTLTELYHHFQHHYKSKPHSFLPILLESFLVNYSYLYRYKVFFRERALSLFSIHFPQSPATPFTNTIKWEKSIKPTPSRDAIFWLEQLKKLCDKYNIELIAGRSPLLKEYLKLPELNLFLGQQEVELNKLFNQLNIPSFQERYLFNETETEYMNMDHLNNIGAVHSTEFYLKVFNK